MKADNPAVYDCTGNPYGNIHAWSKLKGGSQAMCVNCGVVLSEEHTAEVFAEYRNKIRFDEEGK